MSAARLQRQFERQIAADRVAARKWAQEHYAAPSNDDIEIADDADVRLAGDPGFWVAARVYVRRENLDDPQLPLRTWEEI